MSSIHFGVPYKFRVRQSFPYPNHNHTIFEEWFLDNYMDEDIVEGRQYLPIFWNGYHVGHNYGNDPMAVSELQSFIDSLDRSKKYYVLHQFDLGPMVDFRDLDVICFGMSGGRIDLSIPLVMLPHPWNLASNKGILLNFIGRRTHMLRDVLFQTIKHGGRNYIAEHPHHPRAYCEVIAQSTFTLCPRGFGASSFRISEALQYQSIPVYLSDHFIEPFSIPFEEYGVKIEGKDAHRVEEILSVIQPRQIELKKLRGQEVFKEYFTYDGCKRNILKYLRDE